MSRFSCPRCGAFAEIDVEKRTIVIQTKPLEHPGGGSREFNAAFSSVSFPSHPGCELAKSIDEIKLEELLPCDQSFVYEGVKV